MAYKLTYTSDLFPKDYEFGIPGIDGLFTNGKTKTLTAEDEQQFLSRNEVSLKDSVKGDGNYKLEGTSELSSKGGEN